MSSIFEGLSSLSFFDISNFNIQKVTDISRIFSGLSILSSLDIITTFDISKEINMSGLFSGMSSILLWIFQILILLKLLI